MAKKSKLWKPKKISKFNRWQALSLILILATGGVLTLRFSRAATIPWANAASTYGCPLNGYGVPSVTLSNPSSGACVKLLQAALNIDSGTHIPIDGLFGNITEFGTVVFQNSTGIKPANGVVNSTTWAKLATIYNSFAPTLKLGGTYTVNSPGIHHCCTLTTTGQYRLNGKDVNLTVNEWFKSTTTHFVQYGPYDKLAILPGQKGLAVCFDYAAYSLALSADFASSYITVYTDTTYNPPDGLVKIGGVTRNVLYDKIIYISWNNYSHLIREHCDNYPMAVGVYPGMEFRLKVTGSHVPAGQADGSTLDLYRTRVIAY